MYLHRIAQVDTDLILRGLVSMDRCWRVCPVFLNDVCVPIDVPRFQECKECFSCILKK